METLYITQENCKVRAEGEHLRFTRHGETLSTAPLAGVRTIVIFDSVSLSAPALDLLLRNGVDVLYMSKWGKVKARVFSQKGSGAVLRLAQHSAFLNLERRLGISKSIVAAKISNQASVVKKYKLHDTNPEFDVKLSEIGRFTGLLDGANTIEEVMGVEGVSAKAYWDCFKRLLKNQDFTRRAYRPSPDYVNALLNISYSFLANEITTCLTAKSFDLEIGFLHSIHYGRNSLTLDLMEEFRALFIDSWALTLLNKSQLKAEHFNFVGGDWRLTDDGFRKFCSLFQDHAPLWRDSFRSQADKLKTALLKGEGYEPYRE